LAVRPLPLGEVWFNYRGKGAAMAFKATGFNLSFKFLPKQSIEILSAQKKL